MRRCDSIQVTEKISEGLNGKFLSWWFLYKDVNINQDYRAMNESCYYLVNCAERDPKEFATSMSSSISPTVIM